ncbi:MAG TPA: hypothetical protein PLK15_04965 [Chitinophagales bacterium]|jgi:hypothetical protein|nr:hypothetical protein [Chitinophagales bacterium]
MKKLLIVLLTSMASALSAMAQNTDFRGYEWGSSLEKIQESESVPYVAKVSNDELIYRDQLGGYDCDVHYIFNDNDKLEGGVYLFTKKYPNPQFYVEDYNTFKSLLTQKYGKAVAENVNWKNNTTTSTDKQAYGQAVADGNLTLNTRWNTPRSSVMIILFTTPEKQPVLQIYYTARSLEELQNKATLKTAIQKL